MDAIEIVQVQIATVLTEFFCMPQILNGVESTNRQNEIIKII